MNLDLLVHSLSPWLQATTLTGPLDLHAAFEVGEIHLLVNRRHDHARGISNANLRLSSRRNMQAVTLLLKVVHLTLTRL